MREIKLIPNKSKQTGFVPIMLIDVEYEETMEKMIKNTAKICSVTHEMTVLIPDKK